MHPFGHRERSCCVAYILGLSVACLALGGCVTDEAAMRRTSPDAEAGAAVAATASEPTTTPVPEYTAKAAGPKRRAAASHPASPQPAAHDGVRYSAVGVASWYGPGFHGRRTADGETFDMHSLTAAHRTLPLHCLVRVTNLANNRSLLVRVNDRGPYVGDRLIDLSAQSAKLLGFYDHGLAKVKVDYVGPTRRAAPRVTTAAAAAPIE
jgi:rare lipoprotein A